MNHVAAATTPGKSSVASNSTSDSGIDPNNPVLPDQSKTVYIDNDQFLQALKKTNPAAYNKLPQSTIQSMQNDDLLRQGGTYAKTTSDGITIYLNSAIVKAAKILGTAAIAGAAASALATAGLSAGPAATISTAILGIVALLPNDHGVWFHFTNYDSGSGAGNLLLSSWGQQ
ncbi:hypothetical protein [Lacticaseibacillus casei]|uniref:Uncharacterized protein n=1 Tax=Lacticaseibacillus casei TaxID=1582 RepID=A0ABZ0C146_LACCA|nr:hypothetical protein [Lacticaseibacillus casei]KAB1969902.1 hypothetical protein F9B82_05940 [Lacticaseibacillus casei]WNX24930.1 hypothetical protein RWA15_00700 [Lacticaseibacillus casei]WNX27701.1 hypothetical protein RWA16_00700 [Lacticaseibacillus casei]